MSESCYKQLCNSFDTILFREQCDLSNGFRVLKPLLPMIENYR